MNSNTSSLHVANVTKAHQGNSYIVRWLKFVIFTLLFVMPSLLFAQSADIDSAAANSDYIIFVSQRTGATELFLLDLNTKQVSQLTNTGRGHLTPTTSTNARMAAYATREGSSYEIYTAQISSGWRTRLPQLSDTVRLTVNSVDEITPSLTADGRLVAFAANGGIELMTTDGRNRRALVPAGDSFNFSPAISPDGKQVAFVSNRSGANELWVINVATGELRQLTQGGGAQAGLNWTSDSQQIVFTTNATTSKLSGIALADATTGAYRVLTEGGDGDPTISSNGTRVVFTSVRDGDAELYMLDLATNSVQRLTNNPGLDGAAAFVPAPVGATKRDTLPSQRGTLRGRNLER